MLHNNQNMYVQHNNVKKNGETTNISQLL